MKLTKRQAKLVIYLNTDHYDFNIFEELAWKMGYTFGSLKYPKGSQLTSNCVDELIPRITYSETERKDMFKVINWMYGWLENAAASFEVSSIKKAWYQNFKKYLEMWDDHHQEEIAEWQSQPEQQVLAAFEELDEVVQEYYKQKDTGYFVGIDWATKADAVERILWKNLKKQ